jgi:hypothetical protein
MVSSGRTTFKLALSQAPKHIEGEEYAEIYDAQVLQPMYWF